MKWQSWLKVIVILLTLIFITIGFLAGYFYGDKSCIENPLAYGVKQLNELNNDEFTCSCSSKSGKSFYFNEERIHHYLNFTLEEFLIMKNTS